jgi:hypothetical protein
MKRQNTRLEKLEQKVPAGEPVFVVWLGQDPWTPEEKAEEIRKYPGCRMFVRSLLCENKNPDKGNGR